MVNFNINGKQLSAKNGTTILKAAEAAGIPVPHLCYLKDINEIGACRMCMVEIEGTERLVPACNTEVMEGMVIYTNSPKVRQARRTNLLLILSQHNSNCTVCIRGGNCELQKLSQDLNIHYQPYKVQLERSVVDLSNPVVREASKCIKCMRCVQICDKVQNMNPHHRGRHRGKEAPGYGLHLLRPVRDPLPHRRPDRARRHQPGAAGPCRPRDYHRCAGGPRRPRRLGGEL